MYAWFGIRKVRYALAVVCGVAVSTVTLVKAVTPGSSHVAAWMGVSTIDGKNWLQAGIEKTDGLRPAEYIEVGRRGKQISLREWPTTLGHRARIVLYHRANRRLWRITIDGHRSRWTWVPGGSVNTLSLLETYRNGGAVDGVAVIEGRRVHGR